MAIYLDYNASTPIDPRVLDVMIDVYRNHFGNADSRTHDFGNDVREITETARKQVAHLLGVASDEVYFTSGATESNNLAIMGLRDYGIAQGRRHLLISAIEHKSILESAKHLQEEGFEIDWVYPSQSGRIDANQVASLMRPDTLLVSVMHVNNETGVIQPVEEIGRLVSSSGAFFHTDATQSCGKLVEEMRRIPYDLMSISGHKMRASQGIGALILKKQGYRLPPIHPLMYGGAQERGIRPGTLPAALIAGFGKACALAESEYSQDAEQCGHIKKQLLKWFEESGVQYVVNGDSNHCIFTTLNVSFPGVSSEALMLATKRYCGVSNGSACTSRNYAHSHVLTAMGLSNERIESAIRISWDSSLKISDLKEELLHFLSMVKQLA